MGFPLKNEQGITFITTLVSLVIIGVTLPLLSFMFSKLVEPKQYDDIQYEQFFHFLRDDALRAMDVTVANNKLFFRLRNGDTATIEYYDNIIRRQVNGVGHEVYVRNIQAFTVHANDYGAAIEIISTQGETYGKTIPFR